VLTLQILKVSYDLYECPDKIIDSSNIEISTLVARLLKLVVVDHFGKIARWHLGKLGLGEILHMAKIKWKIKWRNEEP
jgi:hypothetical protein